MKIKTKHKKLFYVPGMISLVLIPVLCLYYINSKDYLKQYVSIDIQLSDSFMVPDTSDFHKLIPIHPKRNIEKYYFDGNEKNDTNKLKYLQKRISKFVAEKDSLNSIKIFFGKKMSYETYINILDIVFIEKVNEYVVNPDFIYIVYFPPEKPKTSLIPIRSISCGYEEANKDFFAKQQRKAERELLIKNIKLFWQIPFAMLGMIVLNLYFLIKFNRNRKYNQKSYI